MDYVLEPEVDQLTADLIIRLQLEDAGLHLDSFSESPGEPSDEDLAFQLQNEELNHTSQLLSDRRMARSFLAAVQADGLILTENQVEEDNAARDQDIARRWMEKMENDDNFNDFDDFDASDDFVDDDQDSISVTESTTVDDETLSKLQILYGSGQDGDYYTGDSRSGVTGRTEPTAQRSCQTSSQTRQCIACMEETEFVNVVRAPCRHEYCRGCLEALFRTSITDESTFPPRCCQQPIPLNNARIFLKSDLVHHYEKKKIEYETPNRTYCSLPRCSTFPMSMVK